MDDKKKRLLILALFAVVAIAVTLILTETQEPAQQPVLPASTGLQSSFQPNAPNAASKSAVPALPIGASSTGQTMRDIFSPPAEYAALLAASNRGVSPGGTVQPGGGTPGGGTPAGGGASAGGGGQQTFSAGAAPVLTGVIAGQDSRVVILRQGTISRSYRVGETAGSYRVAAIGNNTATLEGPTGTIVLTMGKVMK